MEKVGQHHTAHQEGEAEEGQADGGVRHHYGQPGMVGNCGWVPVELAEAFLGNKRRESFSVLICALTAMY